MKDVKSCQSRLGKTIICASELHHIFNHSCWIFGEYSFCEPCFLHCSYISIICFLGHWDLYASHKGYPRTTIIALAHLHRNVKQSSVTWTHPILPREQCATQFNSLGKWAKKHQTEKREVKTKYNVDITFSVSYDKTYLAPFSTSPSSLLFSKFLHEWIFVFRQNSSKSDLEEC